MGFWLGTLLFAVLEAIGFGVVYVSSGRPGNKQ